MAWTSMHFAVGMASGAALSAVACAITRRGWRWIPGVMIVGGFWAIVPDTPRLFREDFPWIPGMSGYGSKATETQLHEIGNLFFFHRALDHQPHNYALHGLVAMVGLFTLSWLWMLWLSRRQRLAQNSQSRVGPPHTE